MAEGRTYGAEDLEGHHWYFARRVREVSDYQPSERDLKRHID